MYYFILFKGKIRMKKLFLVVLLIFICFGQRPGRRAGGYIPNKDIKPVVKT